MYCPCCSQEQVSNQTKYCSRCGFLMTGVANLIYNGGVLPANTPQNPNPPSTRKKGLKQGLFMFLLTFLVVPILGIISSELNMTPALVGLAAVFFFMGGLLRMLYALLFESSAPFEKTLEENLMERAQNVLGSRQNAQALPPPQSIPTESYMPPRQGNWRDTNDLQTPASGTEKTTQVLYR